MTLSVGLLSDVHAHRHDQAGALAGLIAHVNAQPAPDLLLLAGDVSHRTAELDRFLGSLRSDCPRCWVPGNHDIWVIDPESPDDSAELRYRRRFAEISEAHGWHYLPLGPRVLHEPDLAVVGTLGWFSGQGFSEWFDRQSSERDQELARRLADELEANIVAVPQHLRLIVVTHHLSHDGIPTLDPGSAHEGRGWVPDRAGRGVIILRAGGGERSFGLQGRGRSTCSLQRTGLVRFMIGIISRPPSTCMSSRPQAPRVWRTGAESRSLCQCRTSIALV